MRSLLLGLAFAGVLSSAAQAQTVEDMIPGCEAAAGRTRTGDPRLDDAANVCMGVADGVALVMWLNCSSRDHAGSNPHPNLSANRPSSVGATIQAWLNWAHANPGKWGDHFTLSFIEVLPEAFPCME